MKSKKLIAFLSATAIAGSMFTALPAMAEGTSNVYSYLWTFDTNYEKDKAANVIDGSEENTDGHRWTTGKIQSEVYGEGKETAYLTVNFNYTQAISKIELVQNGDYAPKMNVYYSTDGSTYETLQSDVVSADNTKTTITPTNSVEAQYIKFEIAEALSGGAWWSIAEIYVYGQPKDGLNVLDRTNRTFTADKNNDNAGKVADDNATENANRWDTNDFQPNCINTTFTVNMDKVYDLTALYINSGGDYAGKMTVSVSKDGNEWIDQTDVVGAKNWQKIDLSGKTGQYIKLTLTESLAKDNYWSIYELNVVGTEHIDEQVATTEKAYTFVGTASDFADKTLYVKYYEQGNSELKTKKQAFNAITSDSDAAANTTTIGEGNEGGINLAIIITNVPVTVTINRVVIE